MYIKWVVITGCIAVFLLWLTTLNDLGVGTAIAKAEESAAASPVCPTSTIHGSLTCRRVHHACRATNAQHALWVLREHATHGNEAILFILNLLHL